MNTIMKKSSIIYIISVVILAFSGCNENQNFNNIIGFTTPKAYSNSALFAENTNMEAKQLNSLGNVVRKQKFQAGDLTSTIKVGDDQSKITKSADGNLKDAPWYKIGYVCSNGPGSSLEILQVVKSSDENSVEIEIKLRFNNLHPKYHKNLLIYRYADLENNADTEKWIALLGAGSKNGTTWTSPETIRIPKKWSYNEGGDPYSAVWDDERQRYRISKWEDEKPFNATLESELFGVRLECYQYDNTEFLDPKNWKKMIRLD